MLVLLPMIVGCNMSKVYMSECTYDSFYHNYRVYKEGKPFDGTLYSDDGNFCIMKVENGRIVECRFYHNNGEVAMVQTPSPKLSGEVLFDYREDEVNYYDEDGNALTRDDFMEKYSSYMSAKSSSIDSVLRTHKRVLPLVFHSVHKIM